MEPAVTILGSRWQQQAGLTLQQRHRTPASQLWWDLKFFGSHSLRRA